MYKHTALETIFPALSTELNTLANGVASALSAEFDNTAVGEFWPFAAVEIYLNTQGTARASGASVSLYIVPSTDGNNYGDITGDCLVNYLVGNYALDAAVTARRITGRIPLPATKYKVVLKNNTGQALAASGNTVKLREYTGEDV